ncbi:MAG TPA: hypothetical protein VKF84_18220 [Candidatus Sulfotelmatobacter sp.]|nr:hypothetical protein [Candidatus Sulfotelmatobacter sp.]
MALFDTQVIQTSENQLVGVGNIGIAQFSSVGLQNVCIRGNYIEASGSSPAVQVDVSGSCIFADNRCTLSTVNRGDRGPAVAELAAEVVVAGNNVLGGGNSDSTALEITTQTKDGYTVLGNIVVGTIKVNGAALPATAPVNAHVSSL